ncbi:hypothetical protein BDV95DRAFT_490267 [Massariosphaeria phaeospora]|uniref:Uncharacterized protein n=1 Tax=Massariosphaeria phaeospora TaxID=100035 RepID=A0A7C8IBY7_9PLEO|nr:hypothetical protein BDV95DRAFT_490267 [Massariosphaeria phaeospora]
MPTPQTVRRWILTGAVTAITMTGTIYGAGLKSRQESHQEHKQILEATPEQRIAQLEAVRTELVRSKTEIERKMAQQTAHRRQREEEAKAAK